MRLIVSAVASELYEPDILALETSNFSLTSQGRIQLSRFYGLPTRTQTVG